MKRLLGLFSVIVFFISLSMTLDACTLWGASGSAVKESGTLIVKNRDWNPDHTQSLKLIQPESGFRYIGLFAEGGKTPGLKAGVNEFGLVVTSATCGDIPKKERKKLPRKKGLNKALLQNCRTVSDALDHKEWLIGPEFLLIADRSEIAVVEIGRNGRTSIERKSDGILFHTNHYISQTLKEPSPPESESSHKRYEQIKRFLTATTPGKFTPEEFFLFSQNREQGPENSIWRTGSERKKTRTVATFLVSIPQSGEPVLRVKTADQGEPEREIELSLTAAFAGKVPVSLDVNQPEKKCSCDEAKEEDMNPKENIKRNLSRKYLIRSQTGPHCKRGPNRCEKCRGQKPAFHLLDIDPPNKGMVQRPVTQVKISGEPQFLEYDLIRTFENEKEARDYARENEIPFEAD